MLYNFSHLFTQPLTKYLEHSFSKLDESLLIYLHLPKAAGNTSIGQLKEYIDPSFSVRWNDIIGSVEELIEEKETYRLASGHLWDEHVQLFREQEFPHYTITFLRHPIQRIVSQYRYMCTPNHPDYESFVDKYPNFEEFAFQEVTPNVISSILVGGAQSFPEYWNKLCERYHFIGLTEHYHLSMAILMNALGFPYEIAERKNVTINISKNNFSLSQKTYQKLAVLHSLDIQLFEHLQTEYAKLSEHFLHELFKKNSITRHLVKSNSE